VARSRTIVIAGAGIGGLTAALALTRAGYRVVISSRRRGWKKPAPASSFRRTQRACSRAGLDRAAAACGRAEAIRIIKAATGRDIVRIPARARSRAALWRALLGDPPRRPARPCSPQAIEQSPDVTLRLGMRMEDFAVHPHGITVQARTAQGARDEQGIALIGADGLWSAVRASLGDRRKALVCATHRVARRRAGGASAGRIPRAGHGPLARARRAPCALSGEGGPRDQPRGDRPRRLREPGWSVPGKPGRASAALCQFCSGRARALRASDRWQKWALFDRARAPSRAGPVTLLGDARTRCCRFSRRAARWRSRMRRAGGLSWRATRPGRAFRAYEQAVTAASRACSARRGQILAHIIWWPLGCAQRRSGALGPSVCCTL
jgi:salicylate hydroxylase